MSEERRDDRSTDDAGEGEGFITRWSQRKAMARDGIELQDEPEDPRELPAAEAGDTGSASASGESAAGEGDEPPELPPLDSLTEDSDYSPFLAAGVSADVQREALRKLFRSPKFNVRDGLDDYDLDFSNPEPLGDIITAEMRHRLEMELERLARLEQEEDVPDDTVATVASDDRAALADTGETPDEAGETLEEDDNDEQPRAS